ncbi:MAG: radical SAM protein [Planctomycetota bacterium]
MTTSPALLPLPRRVQIETTSKCNLRCGSCMHSFEGFERRALGHMPFERFVHILNEIPGLEEVELQGVGEPLLNPDVPRMIREAAFRHITVHTFTNGSRLDARLAGELIDAGLHSLTFSVDGATPAVFEFLRAGGRFEQVLQNIRTMLHVKRERGSELPNCNFNTVVSRRNKDEIGEIIELARSLGGIRNVTFVKLNTLIAPEWQGICLEEEEARALEDRYRGDHHGLEVRFYFRAMNLAQRKACWWPLQWAYISVDGYVTPCCNYFDPKVLNLGNVFVQPFRDIWTGASYEGFRARLAAGRLRHECASC